MGTLNSGVIDQFKSTLRGQLLQDGDNGYDTARTIWNAMIDKRPSIIVRCIGVADVMASVNFAREHNLLLAVRGGGHNIAGNAICDGGLVIDLSQMKSVQINPSTKRAYVEPGATLHDFDHEAQAFGLATPLGINSTTGVAGLTLGGGFGWLSRTHGLSVDNLLAVDIVTADGKLLHADSNSHSDLFWAVRGGGGNFGVVVRFEFQLHSIGPNIFAGLIVYPHTEAKKVLQQYREFVKTMPDHLNVWAVLRQAPPLPFLPAEVHGKDVLILAMFHPGSADEGARLTAPLRSYGTVLGEHAGEMPYEEWQQAFDGLLTPGARNYWKSHNFSDLTDDAIDVATLYASKLPSEQTDIFFGLIGGQANRIAPDATAYPHRNVLYALNVHTRWLDPAEDNKCIQWAREFFNASAPFATGSVYVNFMTQEETGRIGEAYGPNYQRLVAVKNKYDPGNLFRQNQNIKPDKP